IFWQPEEIEKPSRITEELGGHKSPRFANAKQVSPRKPCCGDGIRALCRIRVPLVLPGESARSNIRETPPCGPEQTKATREYEYPPPARVTENDCDQRRSYDRSN